MTKKQQILESALCLFVEKGISETATAEIARHAKVANGTVFHHFDSKQSLVESLYLYLKQQLVEHLNEITDLTTLSDGQVLWAASIQWGLNNPKAIAFFEYYYACPWLNQEYRETVMAQVFAFLAQFVESEIKHGRFVELPIDYIVSSILQSNLVATRYILLSPKHNDEQFIALSYQACINGFIART